MEMKLTPSYSQVLEGLNSSIIGSLNNSNKYVDVNSIKEYLKLLRHMRPKENELLFIDRL